MKTCDKDLAADLALIEGGFMGFDCEFVLRGFMRDWDLAIEGLTGAGWFESWASGLLSFVRVDKGTIIF